jgi:ligand-binding sensor domain-containing protein
MKTIHFEKEITKAEREIHFLIDQQNEFWIGSNGQIIRYSLDDNFFEEIDILENNISIEKTQIDMIYEDNMGNLWISVYGNGIYVKVKDKNFFRHFSKVPFNVNSLSTNIISAFTEDDNNNIWIGTWGGGLNVLETNTNTIKRYKFEKESFNTEILRCLLFESPSTLWAVTSNNGLIKLDISTNKYLYFYSKNAKYFVPSNSLRSIFKDRNGELILAGGNGIYKYERDSDKFKTFAKEYKFVFEGQDSLRFARVIEEDKYGNLWIGTHSLGVFRLDQKDKTITQYKFLQRNSENQVNNNIIYDLKEDKRGLLWIGTMGGGLNIYNPSNKKFYHLTEKSGLPNNIVNGILEDGNNLWISTNNGLCQFKIPSFLYFDTLSVDYFDNYDFSSHFNYYDQTDGIQSKEFKYTAAFKSSTNQMYFGGVNGMNSFNPKDIKVYDTTQN